MVRYELSIKENNLSTSRLWSLWRAIDENENGFISAGEFGRFMRNACEKIDKSESIDRNLQSEIQIKLQEQKARDEMKKEESWARNRASKSDELARAMEAEAARIERLLSDLHTNTLQSGARTRSLPSLSPLNRSTASAAAASGDEVNHGTAVPSPSQRRIRGKLQLRCARRR